MNGIRQDSHESDISTSGLSSANPMEAKLSSIPLESSSMGLKWPIEFFVIIWVYHTPLKGDRVALKLLEIS